MSKQNLKLSIIMVLVATAVALASTKEVNGFNIQQNDIWVIENQKVYKIDHNGDIQATYFNSLLGEPTTIDATDPFRVTVFYQQHQQIEVLDNHGSRIGNTINLLSLDLGEVSHACRSSRGGVWLYIRETNELHLTNPEISRTISQFSVSPLADQTTPNKIMEVNGVIYIGFGNTIERFAPYGDRLEPIGITYEYTFMVSQQYLWTISNGYAERRLLSEPSIVENKFKFPMEKNPIIIGSKLFYFAYGKLNPSE